MPTHTLDEMRRRAILQDLAILDSEPESAYQDIVQLAATLCDVPIAGISLIDVSRQWFVAKIGLEACETPRGVSFCQYTVLSPEGLSVIDATQDDRFSENPLVLGNPFIRSYTGIPISTGDSVALGALFVIDTRPRQFTASQMESLRKLANMVSGRLQLRRSLMLIRRGEGTSSAPRQQVEQIFTTMNSLVVVVDKDLQVKRGNTAASQQLLLSAGVHLRNSMFGSIPSPAYEALCAEIRQTAASGACLTLDEVQVTDLAGERRYFGLTLAPIIDSETQSIDVLILGADITQKLVAQQKSAIQEIHYKRIVDSVRDVIYQIDAKGCWQFLNPAWTTLTGLEVEDCLGREVCEFLPGESSALFHEELESLRRGEGSFSVNEYRYVNQTGDVLWLEIACRSRYDLEGCFIGVSGTIYNTTPFHTAREIETSRRQFEEVLISLSTRFINVSVDEMDEAITGALGTIAGYVGVDRGSVYEISRDAKHYRATHQWSETELECACHCRDWRSISEIPWLESMMRLQLVAKVSTLDVAENLTVGDLDLLVPDEYQSALAVPLSRQNELVGFAVFSKLEPVRRWHDHVIALTRVATNILASAITRKETDQEVQRLSAEALAESQDRLSSVMKVTPIALFVVNLDGTLSLAEGDSLRKFLGSGEDLVGKNLFDVLLGRTRLISNIEQALEGVVIETNDTFGGRTFSVYLAPRFDANNEVSGVLGVCADITERIEMHMYLSHAQKMESIGRLAAGIAHEINTPVQYVGDNLHFLRDAYESFVEHHQHYRRLVDEVKSAGLFETELQLIEASRDRLDFEFVLEEVPRAVEQSVEGVRRVATIVRAMKKFSHPGCDEKEPVDINDAIESTLLVACNEYKYVACIETDFEESLPLLPCRVNEINQVVLNLVVNAAHSIEDSVGNTGAKGLIQTRTRLKGGGIEISVQDSGSGIPPEILNKIWDPFFTTKGVGKGSGQGLAIVQSIVKSHGGTIRIDSKLGTGTTFVMWLPLEPDLEMKVAASSVTFHI